MRDYIVLNGVRSTLIKGLLICNLPPITKPMMRTQTDVVDGRDGDLVTPLGFSAYDKTFEIGLYGDFDVDAVINYFSTEGTVTFSNEPTKYYGYKIINQIDFEKMIRFRKAKITMHVQPFKFSAVEKEITHETRRLISIPPNQQTKYGITATTNSITFLSNRVTAVGFNGTATSGAEFYIPINAFTLPHGTYQLSATTTGSGATGVSFRLIKDAPSNANTFGHDEVTLQNSDTVTISETLTDAQTYNYLYFYVAPGSTVNFTVLVYLTDSGATTFTVTNTGNFFAKPKITIYGSGNITLAVNSDQIFTIALASDGYITIDAEEQEAYKDTTLKNRSVTGNYENFTLQPGANDITLGGTVTKAVIENYSRWL